MPRYEQLKAKSKSITYTRQIKNASKEINLKKPLIISISFIIIVSVIFTVVKKYSPIVDIAIKDFFSINHQEALILESDGITEDENKMSFLNKIPLFNFFIKTDTNQTLSVMTFETNSRIEAALENFTNNIPNSSNIITKESLLPFFNKSGSNNSAIYDSGYVDYGDNHNSILFNENNDFTNNINRVDEFTNMMKNDDKHYNYLEQMIIENRNNNLENMQVENNNIIDKNIINNNIENNNKYTKENINYNTINIKENKKSIFNDILKPRENIKRETTTMKPASSTSFSTNVPKKNIINIQKNNTNKTYNFDINKYLSENNNIKDNEKRVIDNSYNDNTAKELNNRKEIMQNSIYTITNSLNKSNIDYNRVINDMVNPNNRNINAGYDKQNNIINKKEQNIQTIERTIENNIKDNNIKENVITETHNSYRKQIMQKVQNDINNYKKKKENNNITRDLLERELKSNNYEGIYLVEYNENTGDITLIFRERKFKNKYSIEEAVNQLLTGATDNENNRNIISCIPKDTKLLDIFVENDTVYLNFNDCFEFNPLGNEGTMVQIYQFVYTATQFEGIENVIFLINGELNETIGAEGSIENIPFRRF